MANNTMQDGFTIFSSVALSGAFVWLLRGWISDRLKASIQHEYDQKLETHKAQLHSRNEIAMARLRAELEIAAAERQVRYSRVFEKTAEVIAETYAKLLAMKDASDNYTSLMEPSNRESLGESYKEASQEFLKYFPPRKIYVPPETAEKVRIFANTVHRATVQYSMAMATSNAASRNPDTYGKLFDSFFKTSEEVPKLLGLLENEFQTLLGVSAVKSPNKAEPSQSEEK